MACMMVSGLYVLVSYSEANDEKYEKLELQI